MCHYSRFIEVPALENNGFGMEFSNRLKIGIAILVPFCDDQQRVGIPQYFVHVGAVNHMLTKVHFRLRRDIF